MVNIRSRDRGFTLIELLVVVMVLSTLSAISVPVFVRHRANAKADAVRSDAQQAGLALTAQVTGSGILPSALDAQGSAIWGFKASPDNTVAEYIVSGDRFRICIVNATASPTLWAIYASATEKVTTGSGTEPTGACDGNTSGPALPAEPVRGPSTPLPTPTPTAVPTVVVPPPAAPTGVSATTVVGEDRITVSWSAVSGATGYRIYLNGSSTPDWSGTGAPVVLPGLANGTYQVRVTASNNGGEGALSAAASVTVDSNNNVAAAHTINATIAAASNWASSDHSNATANAQSGETTPDARSLWWRFRPTTISTYEFTTIAPSDGSTAPAAPIITVFRVPGGSTAVPTPNPTVLARGSYNPAGSITFSGEAPLVTVESGYDYLVRVSTTTTTNTGKFRVRVNRSTAADMLGTPQMIGQPSVGASTSSSNNSTNAGAEAGETGSTRSSVWFGMQKTVAGNIKFDVTGHGFAPVITVYGSSATNPGSLGSPIKSVTGTSLTLTHAEVPSNQHLRIRVSANSGTPSAFTLNVSTIQALTCFNLRYSSDPSGGYADWDPFPNTSYYDVYVWDGDYLVSQYYVYPGQPLTVGPVAPYETIYVNAITTTWGEVRQSECR